MTDAWHLFHDGFAKAHEQDDFDDWEFITGGDKLLMYMHPDVTRQPAIFAKGRTYTTSNGAQSYEDSGCPWGFCSVTVNHDPLRFLSYGFPNESAEWAGELGDWTFACVLYPTIVDGAWRRVWDLVNWGSPARAYSLEIYNGGIRFTNSCGPASWFARLNQAPAANEWQAAVAICNASLGGGGVKVYLCLCNGRYFGGSSVQPYWVANTGSPKTLKLGSNLTYAKNRYAGDICSWLVTREAWSEAQIQQYAADPYGWAEDLNMRAWWARARCVQADASVGPAVSGSASVGLPTSATASAGPAVEGDASAGCRLAADVSIGPTTKAEVKLCRRD